MIHHGGEDGVARQRAGCSRLRQHHRDDERHLDGGAAQGEDQRAERLAHAVRHHLGMMDGGKHRGDQTDRDQRDQDPSHAPT